MAGAHSGLGARSPAGLLQAGEQLWLVGVVGAQESSQCL